MDVRTNRSKLTFAEQGLNLLNNAMEGRVMERIRPGQGGPPEHLRVSADLRNAMREFAAQIRAGEYTHEELREQEDIFRELAATSDFSDKTPDGPRERRVLTMLSASKAAAEDVLEAIDAFRVEQPSTEQSH